MYGLRRWLLLVVVAAPALLAACASSEDATSAAPSNSSTETAALSQPEVEFLQGMIPHHMEATEMAELVADRSEREELQDFAQKIIDDQSTEIDQMRSLLASAGAPETAEHDMGAMSSGMDDSEMAELEELTGSAFDQMFLDMMTRHHESAVEMAREVLDAGANPEVAALANRIIEAQTAEIEQMATWQDEWSV